MRARTTGGIVAMACAVFAALLACGGATPAGPAAATASSGFWTAWGDGKAELSGYQVTTSRYGAPREARVVLIYVTEPADRRVWIKDDAGDVPPSDRVNVMKLNNVLKFQTGIYPYSVMTSIFSPLDGADPDRFAPVKITLSAQEWCGSVFQKLIVRPASFASELRSYFHADGDRDVTVATPAGTLYEDALLIQLRELDGPFASGKNWSGTIVPSLWSSRKAHVPLQPVAAKIARADASRDGAPVVRFTLTCGGVIKTFDVEKSGAHRVLGWTTSDGESARILKTARLPYWQLHGPGDEKYLEQLGLK